MDNKLITKPQLFELNKSDLNLDDDTYAILDNNDSWINIRAELAKKGIGVTYIRDIEELFNL